MMFGNSYGPSRSIRTTVNWWIVACYVVLVLIGWMNIYAAAHTEETTSIFDWSCRSGKQFVWILTSFMLGVVILFIIPPRVYEPVTPFVYAVILLMLIAVIFVGSDIKGSHSWFKLGPVSIQPAELSKIATSLMLACVMSRGGFHLKGRSLWITIAIIAVPMLIIVAEKETGSALVYVGFVFMLYREGLSGWIIAIIGLAILLFILTIVHSTFLGILVLAGVISLMDCALDGKLKWWLAIGAPLVTGCCFVLEKYRLIVVVSLTAAYAAFSLWRAIRGIRQSFRLATLTVLLGGMLLAFSADFLFNNVLKDYQRERVEALLGMAEDSYNVRQSKIAIGSGGMWGKGFLEGTQTASRFVPEQSTDFIFCTVGEEWGFFGCICVIGLYVLLIYQIIKDSERSREAFTRIYGYCLAGCLFMHLFINIGMTLGLMPVIGIPLPFLSYGGSSIWTFTIMLFIFVALDRNERKYF